MLFWIVALIILLLYFYLNIPVPRNATEPWKLKFTAIMMKIQGDLVVIYALLRKKTPHVEMRAQFERLMKFLVFFQPRIDDIEETVDNFDGVLIRIFKPTAATTKLPGVIYIHGGGWYTFSTKFYSYFTKLLSRKANAVVVSIEYRLAPENVFPAGFDDCVTAAKYFLKNSAKYNVDPTRVGIAGDSAGGNLSMSVSLKLALEPEDNLPNLAFAVLIYPCLQAFDFNLASFKEYNIDRHTHCSLTRNAMIIFNNWYLFGNYNNFKAFSANTHVSADTRKQFRNRVDPRILQGKYKIEPNDDVETHNKDLSKQIEELILNPYFSPLMATDNELKKLPKIYLITCEYDPLRDEGFILSERLKGVEHDLEHLHLRGSEHGVLIFPYYNVYKSTMDKIARYIQTTVK